MMTKFFYQRFGLDLTLALTLACSPVLAASASDPKAAGTLRSVRFPAPTSPVPAEYEEGMEELWSVIDFRDIDTGALRSAIGTDAKTLARHLQENVRFEPYPGVLRGAMGTLLAGAGNSADRALLLAGLLRGTGQKVRFVRATLTLEQAAKLVRASLLKAASQPLPNPLTQDIINCAKEQFLLLGDALHQQGHRAPAFGASRWDDALRECRDHTWIQMADGGKWIDIDPSPGVEYGQALALAGHASDDIDPSLYHTVELALEVERLEENGVLREVVLRYSARSADLAGTPLGLYHETDGETATPFLIVGSNLFQGTRFTVGVRKERGDGGLFSLPFIQRPSAEPTLLSETIRFVTKTPGGLTETSYALFDSFGPARRKAGVKPTTKIASLEGLGDIFGIAVAGGRVPATLPLALFCGTLDPLSPPGMARLLAVRCFDYFAGRALMPGSFLASHPLAFLNAPNIVIAAGKIRGQTVEISLDLTRKEYRLLRPPEDPLAEYGIFYDYLAAGILDQTVERAMVGPAGSLHSVGDLTQEIIDQQIALGMVTAPDRMAGGVLGPDGELRVADAVRAGRVVLLPGKRPAGWPQGSIGWWSIDPKSGWTEDSTEFGYHSATERSVMEKDQPLKQRALCLLAFKVTLIGVSVAAQMGGVPVEVTELIEATHIEDGVDAMIDQVCSGKKTPKWNPKGPSNTMPSPKNIPSRAPVNTPNTPTTRWPPGAARGG